MLASSYTFHGWLWSAAAVLGVASTALAQPALTPPANSNTGSVNALPAPPEPEVNSREVTIQPRATVVPDARVPDAATAELPPAPLPPASGQEALLTAGTDTANIPKLNSRELEALVAPIALYADNVLDNVLDAIQYPVAIRQAGDLLAGKESPELANVLRAGLPRSVEFLRDDYPTILIELNDNLLLMSRLGLAVKAQPEDVVAAIRNVRSQSAAMVAQASDESATEAPVYASTYYADGGVYAGTTYPCYGYYTYGLPNYYYSPFVGYRYFPGSIARLTLGIIYLANGPYYGYPYYPYYGFGYGYGFYGYNPWYGGYPGYGYPTPYAWGNYGNFYGPRGYGTYAANYAYGPYGALYRNGATTGVFAGPNGLGNFSTWGQSVRYNNGITAFGAGQGAANINFANGKSLNLAGAGVAGKTQIGNTTLFGAAGTISAQGSGGRGGTASGWVNGSATVVGNSASWHTQAAGAISGNSGINAIGTHSGSGSLVAFADGSYGWNRNSSNSLQGVNGGVTTQHTGSGTFVGGGNGSYAGSTSIQGNGGKGGTINSTFQNGNLDVNVTPNNPNANLGSNANLGQTRSNQSLASRDNAGTGLMSGNTLGSRNQLGNGAADRLSGVDGGTRLGSLSNSSLGSRSVLGDATGISSRPSTGSSGVSGLREQFGSSSRFSNATGFSNTTGLSNSTGGIRSGTGTPTNFGERFGGYGTRNPTGSLGNSTALGGSTASGLGNRFQSTTPRGNSSSLGSNLSGGSALGSRPAANSSLGNSTLGNSTLGNSNLGNGSLRGSTTQGFSPQNRLPSSASPSIRTPSSGFNPSGNFSPGSTGGNRSFSPSRSSIGSSNFGGSRSIGSGNNFGGGSRSIGSGSIGGGSRGFSGGGSIGGGGRSLGGGGRGGRR